MQDFKIRCSAIGQIMANGRGKETAGATCYSYLQDWIIEQIYGVRKQIDSRPMEKGRMVEDAAIEFAGQHLNWFMPEKNETFFENEFLTGTPDVIHGNTVVDIKCPWDVFTFPMWERNPPKGYWYQLQGYMHLLGLKRAQLVYVLMPTPEELGGIQLDLTNIPAKYRLKVFDIYYDEATIQAIYERVQMCRNIIEVELLPQLQ